MEQLAVVLDQVGPTALWGIAIYQVLDIVLWFGILLLIGHGIKKAWPELRDLMINN